MKKIPFRATQTDLRPPLNEKLQHRLIALFGQYNVQQLPTNFSEYFGAGPTLVSDFPRLANALNPHRLNQNCYYCTIAALTSRTVTDMVADTEIMQQDQATPDEIVSLFQEAGVFAAVTNFCDYTLPAQRLWEHTYGYLDRALAAFDAMGLAWTRQPGSDQNGFFSPASGHMVVVAKDGNGVIAVLDYQSGKLEVLSKQHPPEGAWHQSYSVFQQYAVQATQSWRETCDFIHNQYMKKLSWRGLLVTGRDHREYVDLYHMPDKCRIIAENNHRKITLDKYNDPRGNDKKSAIIICPVK